jgi:hypothetical protein
MLLVAGRATAQVRDELLSFRKLTAPGQGLELGLNVLRTPAPLGVGKLVAKMSLSASRISRTFLGLMESCLDGFEVESTIRFTQSLPKSWSWL